MPFGSTAKLHLMIVTPVAGASLRPLSPVVFTPNSLSDGWIGHVEKAEEKAAQMGKVSNAASRSFHRGKKFDKAKDNDKVFSGDGEEEIDQDGAVGEEPGKGEKYSIYCPGGSNHGDALIDLWSKENRADTGTDSTEEKVSEKSSRSPITF